MYKSVIIGVICLLFFIGCGLETVSYVPPPVRMVSDDPESFFFKTPDLSQLDDNTRARIRGIEIYYKFYKSSDLEESNIISQLGLVTAGFHRLVSAAEKVGFPDIPLIEIKLADRDESSDPQLPVTLNFDVPEFPGEAVAAIHAGGYASIDLRRGAAGNYYTEDIIETPEDDRDYYKRFSDMETTDQDLKLLDNVTDGEPLKLAVYVITYGKDEDRLTTIYSQPVWLSTIIYTFTKR